VVIGRGLGGLTSSPPLVTGHRGHRAGFGGSDQLSAPPLVMAQKHPRLTTVTSDQPPALVMAQKHPRLTTVTSDQPRPWSRPRNPPADHRDQ
jgi:hypothetical protein